MKEYGKYCGDCFRRNDWWIASGVDGDCQEFDYEKGRANKLSIFFLSLAVSMVVGVIAASLWPEGDFRIALLAGYAGSDFLEGLFKLKFKQKFGEVE